MDTIFMNPINSKTPDPHRLLLNLSGEIYLEGSDKFVALSNPSIYYTWKNKIYAIQNNWFKISPTWKEKFALPNGS